MLQLFNALLGEFSQRAVTVVESTGEGPSLKQ